MNYKLNNLPIQGPNYIEEYGEQIGVDVNKILNVGVDSLNSPELFDNIQEGAQLLLENLNKNGKITIIVDCDVDGFTSASEMWLYLKKIAPNCNLDYKIHSGKQHGLEDLIDELENDNNIKLIILPDSSSEDYEYHTRLKESKIPVLVLDHHQAIEYSKNAVVINNQLSINYPNKALTGAGVVYQFCRYLDSILNVNYADFFIDLAALGIISDMGAITNLENAYIIKKGLEKEFKNPFFAALLEKQSYSIGDNLSYNSISFYIAPLINAVIRVGSMEEKEKLFLAFIDGEKIVPSTKRGEAGKTEKLITQVTRQCINLRKKQNDILDAALEEISFKIEDLGLNNNKLLIIELDDDILPSTLNGLLAMKCVSKYNLPTLVVRTNIDGISRGSLRGINNSIFDNFKQYLENTNLCEYCKGHPNAAGVGLKQKNISKLIDKANKDLIKYNFGTTDYNVNFILQAHNEELKNIIFDIDKYKTIYGQGFNEPLLCVENIRINKNDIQIIGSKKDTLKIEYFGITYIIFHAKKMIENIENINFNNINLTIIGKGNVNVWLGKETPQIMISDYILKNDDLIF